MNLSIYRPVNLGKFSCCDGLAQPHPYIVTASVRPKVYLVLSRAPQQTAYYPKDAFRDIRKLRSVILGLYSASLCASLLLWMLRSSRIFETSRLMCCHNAATCIFNNDSRGSSFCFLHVLGQIQQGREDYQISCIVYCYEYLRISRNFFENFQIRGTTATYEQRQNFEDHWHVICAQPTLL